MAAEYALLLSVSPSFFFAITPLSTSFFSNRLESSRLQSFCVWEVFLRFLPSPVIRSFARCVFSLTCHFASVSACPSNRPLVYADDPCCFSAWAMTRFLIVARISRKASPKLECVLPPHTLGSSMTNNGTFALRQAFCNKRSELGTRCRAAPLAMTACGLLEARQIAWFRPSRPSGSLLANAGRGCHMDIIVRKLQRQKARKLRI
jgi:hypothetical protein